MLEKSQCECVLGAIGMENRSLKQAADVIRNRYDHSKVLLFGSHARHNATESSDIDICVIIENPGERLLDIGRNIHKKIFPILHKPLDILVYDKKYLKRGLLLLLLWKLKLLNTLRNNEEGLSC